MLRHVLLALLAKNQPVHGYALMKGYTERLGIGLSIGNVYRELQRLVGEGMIFTAANPPGADPRRAPYGLTERGREALSDWLRTPVEGPGRSVSEEVTFRLAVIGDLDADLAAQALEGIRQELWALAKRIERERADLPARGSSGGKLFRIRETLLRRRAMQLAADIELVEELGASLTVPQTPNDPGVTVSPAMGRPPPRSRQRSRDGESDPR